jgi:hypothetical protein
MKMTDYIKMIKPSTNVKYIIENKNGDIWMEECAYTYIQEAIDELEKLKKFLPNAKFRLIRSEWQVID